MDPLMLTTSDEHALAHLPLPQLEQWCRREIAAYQRHRDGSPQQSRAQYELFRRALVLRDEGAWTVLYGLYEHLMRRWLWTAGSTCSWLVGDEMTSLVNLALSKLARAITAENFAAFAHLPALLGYLRRCTFTVLIDEQRARANTPALAPFEGESFHLADAGGLDRCLDEVAMQTLLTQLLSLLPHPQERLFLIATYRDGDRPRDLVQRSPDLFASEEEVYRIRQRVLRRLQRHHARHSYHAHEP